MTVKGISRFLVAAFVAWWPSIASAGGGPQVISDTSIGAVVRSYISAEEKQDYARVYLLLNSRMREQLRRENGVMDAKDYRKYRQSSEARWFDFSETKRDVAAKEATVVFSATVEENGETERVKLTVRLVITDGIWQIDDCDY